MVHVAIGAGITLIVGGIYKIITEVIRRNVSIKSPESKSLDRLIPAVNELIEIQAPQMDALIAILEAQQGFVNGNIEIALIKMREAKSKYDKFLTNAAKA